MALFDAENIIKHTIVMSTGGVQCVTKMYSEVQNYIGPDSVTQCASDWATAMWDTIKHLLSGSTKLEVVKLQEVTTGEKVVVFPALSGTGPANPHPTHTTLRFTSYGKSGPSAPYGRNQLCLAGIDESFSERGRLLTPGNVANFVAFLETDTTTSVSGVVLRPVVRIYGGAPGQWDYFEVDQARVSPIFRTLSSRRSRLPV